MTMYTERRVLKSDWELQMNDVYNVGTSASSDFGGAINTGSSQDAAKDTYTLTTADGEGLVYFSGNTCSKNGGAVYICGGKDHSIRNAVFEDNAAACGSALYDLNYGTLTIENSVFKENIATNQAGALASEGICYVTNTSFIDNKASGLKSDYYGAAIYLMGGGKMTLKDCYFSGNTNTVGGKTGAIGLAFKDNKNPTLIFQGENILATASDTIYNYGNIVFDISDKTTKESASKAVLNHFNYITNVNTRTFTINVAGNQRSGIYVIANDASKAGTWDKGVDYSKFSLTVDSASSKSITVNGNAVKKDDIDYYYLKKTTANDLVLQVGSNFIFVNNQWPEWTDPSETSTETRHAEYQGVPFDGKPKDRSHFITFQEAVKRGLESGMEDCLLVGVDEGDVNYSVVLKGVASDLTSGNFTKLVVGGNNNATITTAGANLLISGGTYSSNVIGSDYASGQALTETKANTLEITGGTFSAAIAGGMYAYTGVSGTKADLSVGEGKTAVNMVISGGEFDGRIYGGNYARRDEEAKATNSNINGDISITIDCNKSAIKINNGITVGSRGKGKIVGNTTLTFTGNGDNLTFGGDAEVADIWGGSNLDARLFRDGKWVRNSSSVTGDSSLVFDNFKDASFDATFGMFTELKVTKGSNVTFTNTGLDTSDVKKWYIEAGSSLSGLQKNDFNKDSLAFYGVAGNTLMSGTEDSFANLDLASSVLINGSTASKIGEGSEAYWASEAEGLKLVVDSNSLKLAAYAPTLA